jgi:hypothetical protein
MKLGVVTTDQVYETGVVQAGAKHVGNVNWEFTEI